jgi:putative hydroxymethylpyrimidine transport system permease protein
MTARPGERHEGRAATAANRVLPGLLLLLLLGIWQLAASTGFLADRLGLEQFLVPAPVEIAEVLWQDRSLITENAWVTLVEVVLGFLIALAAGLTTATTLHLSDLLRRASYPLVVASQTIPIIVIAPVLVVWFGYGIGPKLAVVALICFFPITVNTLDGLQSVDREKVKMMRTLWASRRQVFTRVEVPTALPYVFSGAKIAVAVAVIGAVFGEWAGADRGLGYLMLQDNAQLMTARLFASVFVLSTIAVSLFALVSLLEQRLLRWR